MEPIPGCVSLLMEWSGPLPASPRPPPSILFIHDGEPYESHMQHLKDAGLRVSETHATSAVATAIQLQPDIIVLDFGCDGDTTRQLKGDEGTKHIPVVALVEMLRS